MSWTRPGRAVAAFAAALAAVVAAALPAAAAPAASAEVPTIYALPDRNLADGQRIFLVLVGFPANHEVGLTQCGIPAGWPEVCDFEHGFNVTTNSHGVAAAQWTVRQHWTGTDPWTGQVLGDVDCKVTQCTAAAASPTQPLTGDVVPIHFR